MKYVTSVELSVRKPRNPSTLSPASPPMARFSASTPGTPTLNDGAIAPSGPTTAGPSRGEEPT